MKNETASAVRLADYRPPEYLIDTISLTIALDPTETRVTAEMAIRRNNGTPRNAPLRLDGDELSLQSVRIDGKRLSGDAYHATPDLLTITAPPEGAFTLTVETLVDPTANTQLMGLYRSSGNYCTQCEAEGFRRITYFLDRPDVLAVYTTRIEAKKDDAPILLANGNLTDSGDLPDGRHYAVWNDPFPKPSYLFAMVAGSLGVVEDEFTTQSGRKVDLKIYVEPGKEPRCAYAMDALKRSMTWDEEAFGREYDLDIFMIVAVSDFNMGAMENKGLNVFNDRYILADPQTATDQDYANIEAVIAHEYFHNWTGNRITCRDWFQLCLKEGLTVFRDQEFSSDQRSRAVKRISDVRLLKSHQFAEDAGPLAHPVRPNTYKEINNFYTATVYEKGAELIRMLKTLLGPEGFRAGMDLYFELHDGEAVTVEDFLAAFADATGTDLSQFMLWYEQAGTPALAVTSAFDATAEKLTLTFEQSCPPTPGQPVKKPMHIPVRFGLVGPDGQDLSYGAVAGATVTGDTIHVVDERHRVTFSGVKAPPVPSLLRGFSAPVKLVGGLTTGEFGFLAGHDSDPFNRWQAIQNLAMGLLTETTAAAHAGKPVPSDDSFLDAMGAIASDTGLDPAFRALALQLPGETDIARDIGEDVDPDAIATARNALRSAIGTALGDIFRSLYDTLADSGPYSPDADAAGRRALRNVALDYLLAAGGEAAEARARDHYFGADNMTDRLAAMTSLVHAAAPAAREALTDFHDRFAGDPLVIDKWFAVQAAAPFAGTLSKVEELTTHTAFSWSNPNRVRSLIGVFATGNPTQFNRADGAGFEFIANAVLKLDRSNPQVAARLLSAFRSWRALEPERRERAEAALRQVAATTPLSADVQDIVSRSLD
ncbi:aminopeptidase N [Rhodobium orientis]|uniref:aminopeptidase N n=1 Tax=Rhodobium orientis TaxID=34017 RepID=UPI00180030BB|nr:aminopeptidase N [Rhodobium orientis]MBB4305062.1 aminopeptidase N [Rhodobium orientis]